MIGYAVINASSLGANTIVAAVAGASIEVIQYTLIAPSNNIVTWKSNTTALSGPMEFSTGENITAVSGASSYQTINFLFKTAASEALILTLGSAAQVSGHLTYRIIRS
tara:strand:- start:7952 stop:8275 length:324 start_codon:yes stop_codon:yes gene_type:complete